MKKLLTLIAVAGYLSFAMPTQILAQEAEVVEEEMVDATEEAVVEEESSTEVESAPINETLAAVDMEEDRSFHQVIKEKFIAGDPVFMSFVVVTLILGLAIVIERILYLSMASSNTKKLLEEVEGALNSGGVEAAKEVCRNTRGPVASIFYQGLDRMDEGIDMVEKSVVSYGSVQLGQLEKGVSWISLFIALAPMLGFFGTVIGMIQAFDAIAAANNISPGIVASGIGVALITTVSGLLVAMVLQVFYNYIIAKIDGLTNEMEDASISLVDILVKYNKK
jgi:biopolymer transport protein ExbB